MPSACSSSTRRRDGREDKEVCRVRLRTASLPRLCGARSVPYYRVYPKTVRRTVVLCRGGPRGRPPPGNHKGCPYGCTSAFGLRMVAGLSSDHSHEHILQSSERCLLGEQLLRSSLGEETTTMQHKYALADEASLGQGVGTQEYRPRTGEP